MIFHLSLNVRLVEFITYYPVHHTKEVRGVQKCFTNANGPEVFKTCAHEWVHPANVNRTDASGEYSDTSGKGHCDHSPPPSRYNSLCKSFNDQIEKLR